MISNSLRAVERSRLFAPVSSDAPDWSPPVCGNMKLGIAIFTSCLYANVQIGV